MANEIQITNRLTAAKGYLKLDKTVGTLNADLTGTALSDQVQNIGTGYEAVVVPAEIATAGWAWFRNLDATNYVELGVVVSATFYPLAKLKPGETACFRLSTTTFYAQAHTAAVNLQACILPD